MSRWIALAAAPGRVAVGRISDAANEHHARPRRAIRALRGPDQSVINEHLGEQVHVAVELNVGFGYTGVWGTAGTLTEWLHPEGETPAMPARPGDEPTGLYRVGEATLHIPGQGYQGISDSLGSRPGVHVQLADNVGLSISCEPSPRPQATTS